MLCAVLFISTNGFSQELTKDQQYKIASQKFLNTHFFSHGEGMMLSPDLMTYVDLVTKTYSKLDKGPKKIIRNKIINSRYGFNIHNNEIVGLFNVPYKGMNIGVLGCVACHSGKAAGRFYVGLGNKTIDAYQVGQDAKIIQSGWLQGHLTEERRKIHKDAMHFAKVISDKNITNLTAGIVPVSVIMTFFYTDIGLKYPSDLNRGQVKVPHLWGFHQKREAGVFAGGEMGSENVSWEFGAELFGSNRGSHLKDNLPKLRKMVREVFPHFLPPKYPFDINQVQAQRWKALFEKTCYKCHGTYEKDSQGYPIFKTPKRIPHKVVKTDEDRLKVIPEGFTQQLAKTSVGDLLTMNEIPQKKIGYLAPRLEGSWARFPYLHNASVPTVYDLLSDPETRPKKFSIKDVGEEYRFDKKRLGLKLTGRRLNTSSRKTYDTSKVGHSNAGHYFKSFKKYTHQDKMDIIEYLKTL